ncbi:MAG: HAD family hydrolase [Chloroflexota bacterium]|nr:HAD family hydrolase [Chloroflexota bacterium]
MDHIEGIIFDLGNTLLHFDADMRETLLRGAYDLAAYLHEQGLVIDAAALASTYVENLYVAYEQAQKDWIEVTGHQTLRHTLVDLGHASVPEAMIDEGIRVSLTCGETVWKPFPDTYETLEQLRAAGYRLGLISNFFDDGWIQRTIDKFGLRSWFSPILTSAGMGLSKPHPGIFRAVLEEWGLPPERVLMVGDTPSKDIVGAQSVGMRAVLATMVEAPRDGDDPSISPDAIIKQLGELSTLLARWRDER